MHNGKKLAEPLEHVYFYIDSRLTFSYPHLTFLSSPLASWWFSSFRIFLHAETGNRPISFCTLFWFWERFRITFSLLLHWIVTFLLYMFFANWKEKNPIVSKHLVCGDLWYIAVYQCIIGLLLFSKKGIREKREPCMW